MSDEIIGYHYIKKRATGEPMGPLVPIYKKDWPLKVAPPSQIVWRYMDLWKFEAMARTSSLYFRRADKLPDRGEGRLSVKAVRGTSDSEKEFAAAYKIAQDYEAHVSAHEITRGCMFVNCWNLAGREDARMWREYTTSPESVVVTSSVKALGRAVLDKQLMVSCVKYVDDHTPRIEFSHTTPFFYKDKSYRFENELRLLRPLREGEQLLVENPEDYGRNVPVNLRLLIHRVISHKRMSENTLEFVRTLTAEFCRRAVVQQSTLP